MNKVSMICHLSEASAAIDQLIAELSSDEEVGPEVWVDFSHVYHHLNTAWNTRNDDADTTPFNVARQFPTDLDMSSDIE